jgi:predicted Rossmann-fold nucleotide-binding protein
MTTGATTRTWAIIGVVGKSNSEKDELLQLAEKVGREIATKEHEHAVLTGGHHLRSERSVKYHALLGAKKVAQTGKRVRLIGIVPKNISRELKPPVKNISVETPPNPNDPLRYAYVHTQLESKDRDAITGQAADVLIALEGKSGTPREIAAALIAGRPVVFLNSLKVLEPLVKAELEKQGASSVFPNKPLEATNEVRSVEMALNAIGWDTPSQRRLDGALCWDWFK